MEPRLKIRNLSKGFGGSRVVDDISFDVAAGEVVCLLGPSGCGKSTTLRMVAGVETETAGDIFLDGASLKGVPPEERSIGLMFQDFALFPHLSVRDNVAYGIKNKREGRARAEALLQRVGLAEYSAKYPHQLSGGEQQRIALARALAPKPSVMLMDEPFSGLDERLRDEVRDDTLALLREERAAVLLVTHDPQEAMRMADEIALMRDGKIVQLGPPEVLYADPVDHKAAAFFSDINILPGIVEDGAVSTSLGAFASHGLQDGARAEIVIRPQHLHIGNGQPNASVLDRRFLGLFTVLTCELNGSTRVSILQQGEVSLDAGAQVCVEADRARCMIFQA
ncbi:MAG: ABC transporter ATP-binding protein [Pseudomonadota bacterium]